LKVGAVFVFDDLTRSPFLDEVPGWPERKRRRKPVYFRLRRDGLMEAAQLVSAIDSGYAPAKLSQLLV
jgi:hypothetical protein